MKVGVGDDRDHALRWECLQRMSWGFRRGDNNASAEQTNFVADNYLDQLARSFMLSTL